MSECYFILLYYNVQCRMISRGEAAREKGVLMCDVEVYKHGLKSLPVRERLLRGVDVEEISTSVQKRDTYNI